MNPLRLNLRFREVRRPLSLARALNLLPSRRAGLWVAVGLLGAFAFGLPSAQAAVTEAWVHRYNGGEVVVVGADDRAAKVVRDAAGDIIVTGYTENPTIRHEMLTIKYSGTDGSVLWQQRYHGPESGSNYASAVDGSGNVVVTESSYNGNDFDYYTAKYAAADGALLWEKRYHGAAFFDAVNAVAVDGSGNVVVTWTSYADTTYYDCHTAKYAGANGALLWEQRYNGPANSSDFSSAVTVDSSGNVVVTGFTYGTNFNYDYYTAKYAAADGVLLWENLYDGSRHYDDLAAAVAVDSSGNVLVTGYSTVSTNPYSATYYTAKYAAANGALLWEKRSNVPASGGDQAVMVDGSGNVVITGTSHDGSQDDYYTAKYAATDGMLLWEKRSTNFAQAVAVDGSGNVVVTGSSYGTNFNYDYHTSKYAAANGALLWEKRYDGPVNGDDVANALTVDGSGNVVVTGYSIGTNFNADYYTAKYAAADGSLLWEKRYDGPNGNVTNYYSSEGRAVAVDRNGNVVVTGVAHNGASWYTAKYARGTGSLLWEQTHNGGAEPQALAVDGGGSVVVTGYSSNGNNNDYYTAKYAAADGALLWEQRYNGPGNGWDEARAVAVDSSGSVAVTGLSDNGNGYDYYTAKYAAADGALLWEQRYNGPANNEDGAMALAVDSSGNVVVTGSSSGTNSFSDYYTAKYRAADGALLWEQRYSYGQVTALAVDGSGNVVVTGSSFGTNFGYYTAKYAAADGALLWEKHYDPGGIGFGAASRVTVDGSGNVVVAGNTFFNTNGYDYYAAKYAAADGALLWEKSYSGPASDFVQAVAVDGSGNVVVTGPSQNGEPNYDYDYYTAKYAAADGTLLWEKRYSNGRATALAVDSHGNVVVTGNSGGDFATIRYREVLPSVSIGLVPAGVRLRFTGESGRIYQIERAPSVTGPWSTLATPTAPVSGLIEYLDVNPPPGQAFYRAAQP